MTRFLLRGRPVLAAALLASLVACAPQPTRHGSGPPLTRDLLHRALAAVHATEEQRASVLGAYEDSRPKLQELRDQSDVVREQIHELDPLTPDYLARADALSKQLGDMAAEQSRVNARFVNDVAHALTPRQWGAWLTYFRTGREEVDFDEAKLRREAQRGP